MNNQNQNDEGPLTSVVPQTFTDEKIAPQERPASFVPVLAILAVVVGCFALFQPVPPPSIPPTELNLNFVVRTNGVMYRLGADRPFTGLVIERYRERSLKSRTAVGHGRLNGLSEGWHTNGVLQIREYFVQGVSHGVRTKWHLNGKKLSEVNILNGKLEGTFLKWHDNEKLEQEIQLVGGVAQGWSRSWFSSGSLKARVKLEQGKVIEQTFFKDNEKSESPTTLANNP